MLRSTGLLPGALGAALPPCGDQPETSATLLPSRLRCPRCVPPTLDSDSSPSGPWPPPPCLLAHPKYCLLRALLPPARCPRSRLPPHKADHPPCVPGAGRPTAHTRASSPLPQRAQARKHPLCARPPCGTVSLPTKYPAAPPSGLIMPVPEKTKATQPHRELSAENPGVSVSCGGRLQWQRPGTLLTTTHGAQGRPTGQTHGARGRPTG